MPYAAPLPSRLAPASSSRPPPFPRLPPQDPSKVAIRRQPAPAADAAPAAPKRSRFFPTRSGAAWAAASASPAADRRAAPAGGGGPGGASVGGGPAASGSDVGADEAAGGEEASAAYASPPAAAVGSSLDRFAYAAPPSARLADAHRGRRPATPKKAPSPENAPPQALGAAPPLESFAYTGAGAPGAAPAAPGRAETS